MDNNSEQPSVPNQPQQTPPTTPLSPDPVATSSEVAQPSTEDSTVATPQPVQNPGTQASALESEPAPMSPFTTQATTGSTPVAPQPAPKRSKKPLLFGIIGGVLLLSLIGGSVYAYTVYQKPENVLLDSASKALQSKQARLQTTITSDYAFNSADTKVVFEKLTFTTGSERTPRVDTNAELDMKVDDKEVKLKGDVLATDEGAIYFRLSNLKDTVSKVFPADQQPSAKALSYIGAIDGKWAKYSIDDLKKSNPDYGKTVQCTLDVYKKYKNDNKSLQELANLYKANQFVVAKGSPTLKNGNYEIVVDIDKTRSRAFSKAIDNTAMAKDLKACDRSKSLQTDVQDATDYAENNVDSSTSADSPVTTTTAVISQFDHTLRAIDVKVTNLKGNDNKTYTMTSHTAVDFNHGVTTSAPSSTMTTDEWSQNAINFYQELSSSSYDY